MSLLDGAFAAATNQSPRDDEVVQVLLDEVCRYQSYLDNYETALGH